MAPRFFVILVLLSLLIGGWLRLHGLGRAHLTHWDEGPYVSAAFGREPTVEREPLAIYAPPLYPLAVRLAAGGLGKDPRVAIAVSGLAGMLAILMAALLNRRLFGDVAGGVAALLCAIDPLQVEHARMALTDTTFTALFLLSVLLFVKAFESGRNRDALLAGLVCGLCAATKYHGVLPLAAAGLTAGVACLLPGQSRRGDNVRRMLRLLFFSCVGLLPVALLLLLFIENDMGLDAFRETRKTWMRGLHIWITSSMTLFTWRSFWWFGSPALLLLAPIGAVIAWRRDLQKCLLLVLPLVLLGLVLMLYQKYVRLLVPLSALCIPLAAVSLAACVRRRVTWGPLVAVVLSLVVSLPASSALRAAVSFHSDAYEVCAERLERRLAEQPGAVIVVAQQALFPYLDPDVLDLCWTITEPGAADRLESGELRYILTDRPLADHRRIEPHLEAIKGRLTEVFSLPNRLRLSVLRDRLGRDRFRAYLEDPAAARFADDTRLRLLELRPDR